MGGAQFLLLRLAEHLASGGHHVSYVDSPGKYHQFQPNYFKNNRPGKTPGWRTHAEAMADEIAAFRSTVALDV